MSYAGTDLTEENAQPVFLFTFTQGADTYRYTNTATDYFYSANTYTAGIVVVDKISQSSDTMKDAVTLQLPLSSALALSFLQYQPEAKTEVVITRTDRNETDGETVWRGTVATTSVSDGTMSVDCEPLYSALKRTGKRATYSRTCRHVLYGFGCGLNPADFAATVTVTSVDGAVIAIPLLPGSPNAYTGGYIQTASGAKRAIASQPGMFVTLASPLHELSDLINDNPGGFAVTVVQGCDHTYATCVSKFNNRLNFGGCPYIPTKNPFVKAVL